MYSPGEVLHLAMVIEENGESFYRDLQKLAPHEEMRKLLDWLAREEGKHRAVFLELKREVDRLYKPDIREKVSRFFAADALGVRMFSVDGKRYDSLQNFHEALALAITLEEDSIVFYELLKSLSETEATQQTLDRIIEEEKSHIATIRAMREELTHAERASTIPPLGSDGR